MKPASEFGGKSRAIRFMVVPNAFDSFECVHVYTTCLDWL